MPAFVPFLLLLLTVSSRCLAFFFYFRYKRLRESKMLSHRSFEDKRAIFGNSGFRTVSSTNSLVSLGSVDSTSSNKQEVAKDNSSASEKEEQEAEEETKSEKKKKEKKNKKRKRSEADVE
jgi:electron transfer flavoprotein alpha subunit